MTVYFALFAAPGMASVAFTGSTQMAKIINRTLAAKDGPIVPLIAETGGIKGAARELVCGDPAELATDIGPVIDAQARDGIQSHIQRLHRE